MSVICVGQRPDVPLLNPAGENCYMIGLLGSLPLRLFKGITDDHEDLDISVSKLASYRLGDQGRAADFVFCKASRPTFLPARPSVQGVRGALCCGGKRVQSGAGHCLQSMPI